MKHRHHIRRAVAFSISFLVLFLSNKVLAAEYQALAPITAPGASISTNNLTVFLIDAFRIAVAASAALAILQIIFGGIQYMSTDAWSGKQDGKKRIQNALWGLLLVMISYLVLRTINPALVDFSVIKNDLQDSSFNPNNAKVIPETGHSGEIAGDTLVQTYSFKASNGQRFSVQGLKTEDLNALGDGDFYSLTIDGSSSQFFYDSLASCKLRENSPDGNVVTACQQVTNGPTKYKEIDQNGNIYAVDVPSLATCQSLIAGKTGWKCEAYTLDYSITVGKGNSVYNNLTRGACNYYKSTWSQSHPGQSTSDCVSSKLQ